MYLNKILQLNMEELFLDEIIIMFLFIIIIYLNKILLKMNLEVKLFVDNFI